MPTKVLMPRLGESVEEGTITRWLKAVGDRVEEYEALVEVNTDKVDTEVPSPAAGTLLEILVSEGTLARAGMELAVIGSPGDQPEGRPVLQPESPVEAATPINGGRAPAPVMNAVEAAPVSTATLSGRSRELGFISPVVAKIAAEHRVDLYAVSGTGQGGRITKKDVLAYLEQAGPSAAALQPAPAKTPAAPLPVEKAAAEPVELPADGEIQLLTTLRRSIAEHMVVSKRTSPHVTTIMEADLSAIVTHRRANKAAFARDGVNLTFTAYFIATLVQALKAYPMVNSSWTDEGIRLHRLVNIGMATSLGEAGLIVPVIKDAGELSLLGIARAVNDLAERARSRRLKPDEVQGGTFTLTNHGISGSLFATPIINQPQCGILGVGIMQKRVVVVTDAAGNDSIAIRPMAYLGLTFDHRILDGATADHFLAKVVEALTHWG